MQVDTLLGYSRYASIPVSIHYNDTQPLKDQRFGVQL